MKKKLYFVLVLLIFFLLNFYGISQTSNEYIRFNSNITIENFLSNFNKNTIDSLYLIYGSNRHYSLVFHINTTDSTHLRFHINFNVSDSVIAKELNLFLDVNDVKKINFSIYDKIKYFVLKEIILENDLNFEFLAKKIKGMKFEEDNKKSN